MPTPNALSERDVRIIEDFVTLIRRQPGVQAPMRLVWMAGHEQVDAVARDFDRLVEDVSKIQTVGAVGIAPSLVC